MSGGLVILGFLFMTFLFRSAVVGDVASEAHRRARTPSVVMPPARPPALSGAATGAPFDEGRARGRDAPPELDAALAQMPGLGFGDARILQARGEAMHVRIYASGPTACEHVRGYLVGSLERMYGAPVKVDETSCRDHGALHCEFLARHPLREVRA